MNLRRPERARNEGTKGLKRLATNFPPTRPESLTHSHTLSLSHSLTLTLSHTHSLSLSHTHSLSLSHTLNLTLSLTHRILPSGRWDQSEAGLTGSVDVGCEDVAQGDVQLQKIGGAKTFLVGGAETCHAQLVHAALPARRVPVAVPSHHMAHLQSGTPLEPRIILLVDVAV